MIESLSVTNHKKKSLIEFRSLLAVKNSLFRWNLHVKFRHYHSQMPLKQCYQHQIFKSLVLDIKDFYLNTAMDDYEYMWLPWWISPQDFIDEHQIEQIFINNRTLVKILKVIYSLPQSGRLFYIALIEQLQLHVYTRAGFTAGLFKHTTRDHMFSLVVDEFGVKYKPKN